MKKLNAIFSMITVLSAGTSAWAMDLTKSLYPKSILTVEQDIILPQGMEAVEFMNGKMKTDYRALALNEQVCRILVSINVEPSEKLRIAKGTQLTLLVYDGSEAIFSSTKGTLMGLRCWEHSKRGYGIDNELSIETLKKSFGNIISVQEAPGSVIDVHMQRDAGQGMNEKLQDI